MAHSVEAVLPLDIVEETYLLPLSMFLLQPRISLHTMPNSSRKDQRIFVRCRLGVLKARKQSAAQFVKHFSSTIQDFNFEVGSLVLVRNSCI